MFLGIDSYFKFTFYSKIRINRFFYLSKKSRYVILKSKLHNHLFF